jgi:hypothetical protein
MLLKTPPTHPTQNSYITTKAQLSFATVQRKQSSRSYTTFIQITKANISNSLHQLNEQSDLDFV